MSALEVFDSFEKVVKAAEEENSGCSLVKTRRHIALSPKYIGRLRTGVHEILDAELGRFVKRWNGVLLAYDSIKLLQSSGAIVDDSPFIYFDVELEAVIFKPSIGSILKCVVNELASDHVGCLVHDWFNVSLLPDKEQINGEWQPGLEPGHVVLVQVEKLQVMNGMLAIEAREPCDGFYDSNLVVDTSDGLLTAARMESSEKAKKKKKTKKSGSDVVSVQGSSNPDGPNAVLALQAGEETNRKKKSKKRKLLETTMKSNESLASNDPGDETTGERTSHQKKKKKKKHGEIETNERRVAAVTEDSKHKVPETTGVETSHKKKKKKKRDKDETIGELTSTLNCSNKNVEVKTQEFGTSKKKIKKNSSTRYSLPAKDESHSKAFTKLKKKKSKLNDFNAKSDPILLLTDSQCELPALVDEAGPDKKAKKKKKKSKQEHDRNDNELMNNFDLEASEKEESNQLDSQSSLTSGSKLKSSKMSHKNHKRNKSEHGVEIAGNGISKKKTKKKKKDKN